jgi:hypothetical protein
LSYLAVACLPSGFGSRPGTGYPACRGITSLLVSWR